MHKSPTSGIPSGDRGTLSARGAVHRFEREERRKFSRQPWIHFARRGDIQSRLNDGRYRSIPAPRLRGLPERRRGTNERSKGAGEFRRIYARTLIAARSSQEPALTATKYSGIRARIRRLAPSCSGNFEKKFYGALWSGGCGLWCAHSCAASPPPPSAPSTIYLFHLSPTRLAFFISLEGASTMTWRRRRESSPVCTKSRFF